ncbi:MAG: LCP family protein [Coriobacteriales bacterium]|nr:LCP family protein [Coriobacteriales bacterium]
MLFTVAALLVLVAAGLLISSFLYVQHIDEDIALPPTVVEELEPVLVVPEQPDQAYYVLVIGTDYREDPLYLEQGGSIRSDTIMLARIDPEVPQVTVLSIPRDTEYDFPDHGIDKINYAFASGGPAGVVAAVSDLCGVDIAHYVELDFQGVVQMVDLVGGVTVDVPVDLELDGVFIPRGVQTLDGSQALIMSRCRTFPNDFVALPDLQRVQNQRLLVQAVASKVLAADIGAMPGLISELAKCVSTDLSATDVMDLALKMRGMDAANMYLDTIPVYANSREIDGVYNSLLSIDQPAFAEMMERVDSGLSPRAAEGETTAEAATAAEPVAETTAEAEVGEAQ